PRGESEAANVEAGPARFVASLVSQISVTNVERERWADRIHVVDGQLPCHSDKHIAGGDVVPVIPVRPVVLPAGRQPDVKPLFVAHDLIEAPHMVVISHRLWPRL